MRFSRQLWLLFALFLTAVFVVLGMSRFHEETANYRPVVPPYDFFWCAKDADCAVVGEYNISGQDHIEKLKKLLWQDDRDLSVGEGIHSLAKGWGGLHLQVVMLRKE